MVRKDYSGISLPKDMMDFIDEFIKSHPELGYSSTAEFVKEAIRYYLKEMTELFCGKD